MIKKVLLLLSYARLEICVVAISMTAANSIVLIGSIQWQAVVIVGLSTYAVYNIDNLLDYTSDKHRGINFTLRWNLYIVWVFLTIPISLIGAFLLAIQSTIEVLVLLGVLGMVSIIYIWLTRSSEKRSAIALWTEHLTDALSWALVIVLIPVFSTTNQVGPQVVMAIAYMWQLCWTGVMVWNLSNSAIMADQYKPLTLAMYLGNQRLVVLLQAISVTSIVLAIIDILLGYFPWFNIIVIAAPMVNIILLQFWERLHNRPRMYSSIYFLAGTLSSIMIIIVYLYAERGM